MRTEAWFQKNNFMAQLQKGTTYATGAQVTADNLNKHVDEAILLPGAITEQIAATSVTAADSLLIYQPSIGLRKATLNDVQQIISGFQARVVFDGRFASATTTNFTWSKVNDIVTITCNNHGFTWLNACYFDFITGTGTAPADGNYYISLLNLTTNTFVVEIAGSTGTASGTGTFKRCPFGGSNTNSFNIGNVCWAGAVTASGYWINFDYQYYNSGSITPVAYVSPSGSSTAAYALFGKATTLNTLANQSGMLEGGFLMNVYTTGNVAVDSGINTNVLVTGGSIRPAI